MAHYKDAAHVASALSPARPAFCNRPHAARAAARAFLRGFAAETFYAVKANPSPWLLDVLYEEGVRKFEVASIAEVRLIGTRFPDAEIAFMHPIKAPEAIAEAYRDFGARAFALDSLDELQKILAATGDAADLTLVLRHRVANDSAKISLGSKFGAEGDEAVALLAQMRQSAHRLGVSFHVGSQTMSVDAYINALNLVEQTIIRAGVIVDVVDVGGGFPALYPGFTPPPLADYFAAIERRFEQMLVAENCALWCEPGRALCAEASSLIVRVEGRKGDRLHLNEGVYGALFDAGHLGWPFPARALGETGPAIVEAFAFYGPTCDDFDYMPGPFYLPADIKAGDHIEIGVLGAYGVAMRTGFNGFTAYDDITVEDAPMLTMYAGVEAPSETRKTAHV